MTIILFCVFNLTTSPPGTIKQATISVNREYYDVLKTEPGHVEKLKLCRKTFHHKADLAWLHDG